MTREEAKEVLDDMKVKIDIPKSAVTQHKRNEALDMAISALSENNGEWVPVFERLPEESKNYLVVIRERFNKDHWWIDICDIDTDGFAKTWNVREPYYVEAWQPLPEPYKKGE